MAITTTLARSYSLRLVIIGIVCIVLGLWGIYDYEVVIPRQQQAYARYYVLETTKDALETSSADEQYREKTVLALQEVNRQIDALIVRESTRIGIEPRQWGKQNESDWSRMFFIYVLEPDNLPDGFSENPLAQEAKQVVQAIKESGEGELEWLKAMLLFNMGLGQPRRPQQAQLTGPALRAYEMCERQVALIGSVKRPGKYDRIIKGLLFIPCLPCGLYFFWDLYRKRRRTYRLDDDGSLHLPDGTWERDQIADIDMSRWMAKSIAHVVHADGMRIKFDDYLYKNMHLIVGALAHRFHPEEWTEDAKPVDAAPADDAPADELPEDAVAGGEPGPDQR